MTENRFLRDTNLPGIAATDGRRLEIVAVGSPLYHGVPLGCDATLVSPLHANGHPVSRAAVDDGAAIRRAEANKRRAYPELVDSLHLRLVVLACELGGRWSATCVEVVSGLAGWRSQAEPPPLRAAAQQAWSSRWWALLSVTQQRLLAGSLLDTGEHGVDAVGGGAPTLADLVLDAPTVGPSRLPLH